VFFAVSHQSKGAPQCTQVCEPRGLPLRHSPQKGGLPALNDPPVTSASSFSASSPSLVSGVCFSTSLGFSRLLVMSVPPFQVGLRCQVGVFYSHTTRHLAVFLPGTGPGRLPCELPFPPVSEKPGSLKQQGSVTIALSPSQLLEAVDGLVVAHGPHVVVESLLLDFQRCLVVQPLNGIVRRVLRLPVGCPG